MNKQGNSNSWTTLWSLSQRGCGLVNQTYKEKQSIHIHLPCSIEAIRFRFSNFYDNKTFHIQDVKCTWEEEAHPLFFSSVNDISLNYNETVLSDPIYKEMRKHTKIKLSYMIQGDGPCCSAVDLSREELVKNEEGILAYLFQGIEVISNDLKGCVVTFGDSITEMNMWTCHIKKKVMEMGYGFSNQGIGGNRLLRQVKDIVIEPKHAYMLENTTAQQSVTEPLYFHDIPLEKLNFGKSGLQRLEKEVLKTHENVSCILFALGVNDLYIPGSFCGSIEELPSIEEMKEGYQKAWKQIQSYAIPIIHLGITSFKNSTNITEEKEDIRLAINTWLSQQEEIMTYPSFDEILCDEDRVFKKEYHNGDYLHPNEKGGEVMAKAIWDKLSEVIR